MLKVKKVTHLLIYFSNLEFFIQKINKINKEFLFIEPKVTSTFFDLQVVLYTRSFEKVAVKFDFSVLEIMY